MMKKIDVEVCAYSLESCLTAQEAGADRVELCTGMYDGGTTPSAAMIELARERLDIELSVMLRPRGGDFLYSAGELEIMKRDLLFIRNSGADGVVLGLLNADGTVDVQRTAELVEMAYPMKVTFHRAFDMVADARQALEDVVTAGCYRILTSGRHNTAPEGLEVIRKLAGQADGRIRIMAGSGVNAANVLQLAEAGVDAVHLSGKSAKDSGMVYRNPDVFMGGVPGIGEYDLFSSDRKKIVPVVNAVDKWNEIK